jgi:hypothetical protein
VGLAAHLDLSDLSPHGFNDHHHATDGIARGIMGIRYLRCGVMMEMRAENSEKSARPSQGVHKDVLACRGSRE